MKPILNKAMEEYPDKIRLVYKHFDRGGSDLFLAAATECAAEQDNFWGMHDYIFDNQRDLADKDVDAFLTDGATQIGIDVDAFNTCREEQDFSEKIKSHTEEAYKLGVSGTPAFFINDIFIGGAVSFESLKAAIDSF
jgi:protein-disulfide isomerase